MNNIQMVAEIVKSLVANGRTTHNALELALSVLGMEIVERIDIIKNVNEPRIQARALQTCKGKLRKSK